MIDINTVSAEQLHGIVVEDPRQVARVIDHTLLKPQSTVAQVEHLCTEAIEHHFASICIQPTHVKRVAGLLTDTPVRTCTVVGFPLGANTTAVKVYETQQVLADGATEVDMVINIGALKDGNDSRVGADIAAVVEATHHGGGICKVIIETILLTDNEKVRASKLVEQAGAEFVKTSTGFAGGGATIADVRLMRQSIGPQIRIKAAGGIRSLADAIAMIEAGATRLGTSAGLQLLKEAQL